MQSVITAQSRVSPASISAADRSAQLVGALERRDAEPGRLARARSSAAERKGCGTDGPSASARRTGEFAGGQHEAAADGIVGLLQVQVARRVPGREHEAVGVAGQGGP